MNTNEQIWVFLSVKVSDGIFGCPNLQGFEIPPWGAGVIPGYCLLS